MAALRTARVIVFAKDMQAMTRFYGDVLGLPRRAGADDSYDFVSFAAGDVDLALHAVPARWAKGIEIADPPGPRMGAASKVAFSVDDVARTAAELNARGASFGEVNAYGELHLCDGIDPEGNVIQLSNR